MATYSNEPLRPTLAKLARDRPEFQNTSYGLSWTRLALELGFDTHQGLLHYLGGDSRHSLFGRKGVEMMERAAELLGVEPEHFAEYRLWKARKMLDFYEVGFDEALRNLQRLEG